MKPAFILFLCLNVQNFTPFPSKSHRKSLTAKEARPYYSFNSKKYIDHLNIAPLLVKSALKSNHIKEWGAPCSTPFVIIRLVVCLHIDLKQQRSY